MQNHVEIGHIFPPFGLLFAPNPRSGKWQIRYYEVHRFTQRLLYGEGNESEKNGTISKDIKFLFQKKYQLSQWMSCKLFGDQYF